MMKVELWGSRPGGRFGTVPSELVEEIRELIHRHGNEAVAQVAVLESQVLPVDQSEPNG